MIWMLLVAGGIGLGVYIAGRAIAPPRTDLVAGIGRWELSRSQASRPREDREDFRARLGRWSHDQLVRRGVDLATIRPDLAITGRTVETWLATTVLTAGIAFLLPSVLIVLGALVDVQLPVELGLAGGLFFAAAAIAAGLAQLRSEAASRRQELVAALATYLDLFSMSLAAGRGVPEAMVTSSRIGTGWAFELIQDTISAARRTGETPWQALGDLGEDVGLHELVDLASALTLVGDNGAKVRASLSARSGTLRRRQLAEAAADAAKNDDSMRVSQLLMGAGFMLLIGYPAVTNVLSA